VRAASRRIWAIVDRLEEGFMALALAFMTIATFVQVVLRYLFGTGLVWALEATVYTFAWLVLIGMSYGIRTQAHIVVDLVTSKLSPRLARAVAIGALAVSLLYCALMVVGSAAFVERSFALGNYARDIPLPRWFLTGIMPIAFALLAVRLLQAAWGTHVAARDRQLPPI
jgi:C4-dicarboxylate transporter DctQ subunit